MILFQQVLCVMCLKHIHQYEQQGHAFRRLAVVLQRVVVIQI